MKDAPISYKAPEYTALDAATEQKLGLPEGLLASIRLNGERSNADQVSEAGARTAYQITPATRKLALDRWGIDPYLSAQNAAEVAGRLLKDSLTRNQGDLAAAAGEYHGGTDRSNWGPRTQAYIQRVTAGLGSQGNSQSGAAASSAPGTESANEQALIARAYEAYRASRMDPQAETEFEQDVSAGLVKLPLGASLKRRAPARYQVPDSVIEAYVSGRMDPEAAEEFEQDVRANPSLLPDGITMGESAEETARPGLLDRIKAFPGQLREAITGAQRRTAETDRLPEWTTMPELNSFSLASAKTGLGTLLSNPKETVQVIQANFPGVQVRQDEKGNYLLRSSIDGQEYAIPPGFTVGDVPRAAGAIAAFTPAGRATTILGAAGRSAATQAVIEGSQAATGGTFDPEEVATAGAFGAAVPVAGNVIRYGANKAREVGRRLVGAADRAAEAGASPGGAMAGRGSPPERETRPIGNGAAPVEPPAPSGQTSAAGGSSAGAAAESVPAGGVQAIWRNADTDVPVVFKRIEPTPGADGRMYARVEVNGRESFVPADELVLPRASGAPSAQPGAAVATAHLEGGPATAAAGLTPEELGQATRKAAAGGLGSKRATKVLAQEAAPDPEAVAAARRLGIEDYLQPDHVTTNQAFRELSQVLKSVPGSASGAAEKQGLEQVAKRADDLITEIGGTHDLSTLDATVKRALQTTRDQLKGKADKLYDQVREAVPARSEVEAANVLAVIEQRAADLGGKEYLSRMEKQILGKLSPKQVKDASGKVVGQRQPTYALLDDVRRDLTAAKFKRAGAFKDADDRLVDMLQGALREDQQAAAARFGMGETWDLAQKTAAAYKGVQDDMAALFGRELDGSLVGDLSRGVAGLAKGDTARFRQLLRLVPEDMRQELVASGLATAFGKNARNGAINFGSYAKWYEGLQKNQQAFTALMANLPPSARQGLRDLYVVSNGISKATRERITTGRLTEGMKAIEQQLEPADTLMARVYQMAKKAAGTAAAEALTTTAGTPWGRHGGSALQRAHARTQAQLFRGSGQAVRVT